MGMNTQAVDSATVPSRLAEVRRAHGFTQRSLAAATGLNASTIANIERRRHWPTHASQLILAAVLDCAPADLFGQLEVVGGG